MKRRDLEKLLRRAGCIGVFLLGCGFLFSSARNPQDYPPASPLSETWNFASPNLAKSPAALPPCKDLGWPEPTRAIDERFIGRRITLQGKTEVREPECTLMWCSSACCNRCEFHWSVSARVSPSIRVEVEIVNDDLDCNQPKYLIPIIIAGDLRVHDGPPHHNYFLTNVEICRR
jgi:hypothetical protein